MCIVSDDLGCQRSGEEILTCPPRLFPRRLGLYIVGRQALFANCFELQPTFKQLLARPTQLATVKGEGYGACSRKAGEKVK